MQPDFEVDGVARHAPGRPWQDGLVRPRRAEAKGVKLSRIGIEHEVVPDLEPRIHGLLGTQVVRGRRSAHKLDHDVGRAPVFLPNDPGLAMVTLGVENQEEVGPRKSLLRD